MQALFCAHALARAPTVPAYNGIVSIHRTRRFARKASAAVALAAALVPGMAHSQMYACEGTAGHKIYSDVPCGSNSKTIEVKPSGGSASVNPYDLDTNHGLKQWTPYR
jgi:Domain of unknown function (DUF4124)